MTWIQSALLSFCQWSNATWFGHRIRDSVWLFPAVEIVHLLGLGVLGGAVLLLNLRLLGLIAKDESASALARQLRPWMLGSLAVMLVTGYLLFSTEAVKMYHNRGFHAKMLFLLLAVVFTFVVQAKIITDDKAHTPLLRKATALLSLLLWLGVGLGGRAIGYIT